MQNIYSSIIFFSIILLKYSRCNHNETTEQKPPTILDDYGDDDWLEIDDMLITTKYFRSGLSDRSFRWDLGIVPFEFKEGHFDEEQQNLIVSIMNYISEFTCIQFVSNKDKTHENYLYIRNGRGFQAAVGNTRSGPQWVLLETTESSLGQANPGYYYGGAVTHELLHALGFEHEHQRDDRDSYINIHYENINNDRFTLRNFLKASELGIAQENFGIPYNYESIMQYPGTAFTNNRKPTMSPKENLQPGVSYPFKGQLDSEGFPILGQTSYLSLGDILKIQKMYEGICPDTEENAPGGPFTTNITTNRALLIPKSRQLKRKLEKLQNSTTTVAPTTSAPSTSVPTSSLTTFLTSTTSVPSTTTETISLAPQLSTQTTENHYEITNSSTPEQNNSNSETTTEGVNVIGNLSDWHPL